MVSGSGPTIPRSPASEVVGVAPEVRGPSPSWNCCGPGGPVRLWRVWRLSVAEFKVVESPSEASSRKRGQALGKTDTTALEIWKHE